jgi:putative membrane protein
VIEFMAVVRLSFLSTARSHPLRALAVLLLLSSVFAPSLVAFAFSGGSALAVSGALGSAALLAPTMALFGGVLLAAGDRGGEGFAPILRGSASAGTTVLASALGVGAAAALASLAAAACAAGALLAADRPFSGAEFAGAELAACAAAPASAAAGLLLAVAAPRPLAAAIASLLAGALLVVPGGSPAAVVLLARDAAFLPLGIPVVLLSCAASLAAGAAVAAAATVLLRVKDLAPRPRDA